MSSLSKSYSDELRDQRTGIESYRFYPAIFYRETLTLSLYQDGCYRRLIDEYMRNRCAPLPDNESDLARIYRVSLDDWTVNNCGLILSYFDRKNGCLSLRFERCGAKLDPRLGRLPTSIWNELKNLVFKRDDYTCTYCGERGGRLECDHKHPKSKGGSDAEDNLATACFDCNRAKGSMSVAQWKKLCAEGHNG